MDKKKEEEIPKEKEKNLEIFENYVLKKNEEAPTLYILSGKYLNGIQQEQTFQEYQFLIKTGVRWLKTGKW